MKKKRGISLTAKFAEALIEIQEIGKERNGAVIFTSGFDLTCPLCNTRITPEVVHSCSNGEAHK